MYNKKLLKKLIILKFCFILNFIIDKNNILYYNMRTFLYKSKDLVSSCSCLGEVEKDIKLYKEKKKLKEIEKDFEP